MTEYRRAIRIRTLRGGKLMLNDGFSVIDCVVRNVSDSGACLQVESLVGIPKTFTLRLDGERFGRPCEIVWQSDKKLGIAFRGPAREHAPYIGHDGEIIPGLVPPLPADAPSRPRPAIVQDPPPPRVPGDPVEMLRAALDHVIYGVLLLDSDLDTLFANRTLRQFWGIPAVVDGEPSFEQIMRRLCADGPLALPAHELEGYLAVRCAIVRAGDPTPMDLHLGDGRDFRLQCAVLPEGGRMLTVTNITDLAHRTDPADAATETARPRALAPVPRRA